MKLPKDYEQRLEKVDDRIKVLIRKYPLVFAACVLGGVMLGLALGAWIF
jgi:hypothetical protein